jgi:hypothetical protein
MLWKSTPYGVLFTVEAEQACKLDFVEAVKMERHSIVGIESAIQSPEVSGLIRWS